MNYLDLIILIPVVWGAFNGFRKGFIIEIASLFALIAGIYGSVKFSFLTAQLLKEQFDWSEKIVQMLSFVITFIVIVMIVHLIARLIQKIVTMAAMGTLNRIFGSVFGAAKFLLLIAGVLYIVSAIDSRYPFIDQKVKESSLLYLPASKVIPWIYPSIEEEIIGEDYSLIA